MPVVPERRPGIWHARRKRRFGAIRPNFGRGKVDGIRVFLTSTNWSGLSMQYPTGLCGLYGRKVYDFELFGAKSGDAQEGV